MTKREAKTREQMYRVLSSLGLSYDECETLRRCSMTLHSWAEGECGTDNSCIERDENGKTFRRYSYTGKAYPIADRETGALRRAKAITDAHGLMLYHQGDPRGASLYVLRPSDLADGASVDSCYNRGVAVHG
jgi:hypothetical protein